MLKRELFAIQTIKYNFCHQTNVSFSSCSEEARVSDVKLCTLRTLMVQMAAFSEINFIIYLHFRCACSCYLNHTANALRNWKRITFWLRYRAGKFRIAFLERSKFQTRFIVVSCQMTSFHEKKKLLWSLFICFNSCKRIFPLIIIRHHFFPTSFLQFSKVFYFSFSFFHSSVTILSAF